jgi:hypothetical protein
MQSCPITALGTQQQQLSGHLFQSQLLLSNGYEDQQTMDQPQTQQTCTSVSEVLKSQQEEQPFQQRIMMPQPITIEGTRRHQIQLKTQALHQFSSMHANDPFFQLGSKAIVMAMGMGKTTLSKSLENVIDIDDLAPKDPYVVKTLDNLKMKDDWQAHNSILWTHYKEELLHIDMIGKVILLHSYDTAEALGYTENSIIVLKTTRAFYNRIVRSKPKLEWLVKMNHSDNNVEERTSSIMTKDHDEVRLCVEMELIAVNSNNALSNQLLIKFGPGGGFSRFVPSRVMK